jgi:hypothetical protein
MPKLTSRSRQSTIDESYISESKFELESVSSLMESNVIELDCRDFVNESDDENLDEITK